MAKFLIIQTAFIGDVILATPVIEALHAKYPEASIDFLVRKGNEGLLQGHPYISCLYVWNKNQRKYANLVKIIRDIRKARYDVIINLHRFLNTGTITVLSGAKETVGFTKNPLSFFFSRRVPHIIGGLNGNLHEIDRNLMLISHLVPHGRIAPKLYPSRADFTKTRTSRSYITISPTSVWYTKQYPPDLWARLIDLTDSTIMVYLLGASADIEACESIRLKANRREVEVLAGKLSLLEAAALMKYARMNYTNDSAPLHLASAMDAPVTAVFCSTVPAFGFGPLSPRSFVVETPEKLSCRPCGIHGFRKCPKKHFNCSRIDPQCLADTLPG